LLHGTGPEKTSLKTAAGSEDPALQSPFFPKETGEGPASQSADMGGFNQVMMPSQKHPKTPGFPPISMAEF
jgi:hypothetical protein